jgi:DNA-binding response OmpR family regulator
MGNNGMKKILFIEDEPTLQKTVGEILGQEGFTILEALDGESGIQLAKKEKPDLILLDLILPKKNGFEVLKELKGDPETRGIRIVVLTNLESSTDIERSLELGATNYLVKANYNLEEVVAKIKELLG